MTTDDITFTFEGRIADEHEMNFYEVTRFQYAAARLIYKLEYYRQTGHVLDRVTRRINTDIRVGTAQAGSWELSVLLDKIPILEGASLKVPLGKLFSYILKRSKPKAKGRVLAYEIAKLKLLEERERTKQSEQETLRVQTFAHISKSQNATTQQALKILENITYEQAKEIADNSETLEIEDKREYKFIIDELMADLALEEDIEEYLPQLEAIPSETEARLIKMFQQSATELAVPLRNSADYFSIKSGTDKKTTSLFNRESLENISTEHEDDLPTSLIGSIKAYDKETGWGKFRNNEQFPKPIPFFIPQSVKKEQLKEITEAMSKYEIEASFYIIRDVSGSPTKLKLSKIIPEEH